MSTVLRGSKRPSGSTLHTIVVQRGCEERGGCNEAHQRDNPPYVALLFERIVPTWFPHAFLLQLLLEARQADTYT